MRFPLDTPVFIWWRACRVPLPVNFLHTATAGELPPHHRDPFDRILVAQALAERLTLVSHDRRLEPYGTAVIWA